MVDSGFDGSSNGPRFDYAPDMLPDRYQFLDVWNTYRLHCPGYDDLYTPEFVTITAAPARLPKKKHMAVFNLINDKPSAPMYEQYTPILVLVNPRALGIHREYLTVRSSRCFLNIN